MESKSDLLISVYAGRRNDVMTGQQKAAKIASIRRHNQFLTL
jgi:hypothetical protein